MARLKKRNDVSARSHRLFRAFPSARNTAARRPVLRNRRIQAISRPWSLACAGRDARKPPGILLGRATVTTLLQVRLLESRMSSPWGGKRGRRCRLGAVCRKGRGGRLPSCQAAGIDLASGIGRAILVRLPTGSASSNDSISAPAIWQGPVLERGAVVRSALAGAVGGIQAGRAAMAQTIIVTGGARGVGRACADAFLAAGWRVGILGRTPSTVEAAAARHNNALALPCDVANAEQVDAAFDRAVAEWGRIDALFNNAGISVPGALIDEVSSADWRRCIDVNLTGSFLCARAAFARMRTQKPQGGRIINNGSVSAHVPRWGSAPYTASKHAITGLTRSISLDGRPYRIACGQIDIGNALTAMAAKMQEGVPQADGSVAAEPVIDVVHVADAVLHMASLPLSANVQFMTVMASAMPYIGRG